MLPSGPKYKSHQVQDGEIHIQFDYVGKGLIVGEKNELDPVKEKSNGQLRRFAIAGNDKNWVWADAKIDGDSVIVSSEKVDNPEHVRYAYSANPEGANLIIAMVCPRFRFTQTRINQVVIPAIDF